MEAKVTCVPKTLRAPVVPLQLLFTAKFLTRFQSGIAKRWRVIRNKNQGAFSNKRMKTCDNDCQAPWSDLNQDVLLLVMMQLEVVDFHAFSGVCKSWKSLAFTNKNKFMASRPPISISICTDANGKGYCYYSNYFEGWFKTSRKFVGSTCGYMIFFGRKTHNFWLVNRKIRHELHFDANPFFNKDNPESIRAFLVFSPSMSGWVFVMTEGSTNIWFSIAGQGAWNHVSSTFSVVDLRLFKGKMYTINSAGHLCELKLNPEPKLMLLEMKNLLIRPRHQQFFSTHDSLYVMRYLSKGSYEFHKLDFEEMTWVTCKRSRKAFPVPHGKGKLFFGNHFHDCLNDNLINE